jgi:hypothetical protein
MGELELSLFLGLLLHCLSDRVPSENALRSIRPFLHGPFSEEIPTSLCKYSSQVIEKNLASMATNREFFRSDNCDEIEVRFDEYYCVDLSNTKNL